MPGLSMHGGEGACVGFQATFPQLSQMTDVLLAPPSQPW